MKKIVILALIVSACSYSKPLQIPGFKESVFSSDRGSCNNKRAAMRDLLFKNKDLILGISENEVFKTLITTINSLNYINNSLSIQVLIVIFKYLHDLNTSKIFD